MSTKKDKFFTVMVEGATTDGRKVTRAVIEQMASTYNVATRPAFINIEHLKSYDPTSVFRSYGLVKSLRTKEITDGSLSGKLALQAQLEPTDELIALNRAKQKLATSVEFHPDFAGTGQAYLMGLAVTDNPASLGTEILQFSANAKNSPFLARKSEADCVFSAADCALNLLEEENQATFSSKLNEVTASIKALFSNHQQNQNADFNKAGEALDGLLKLNQELAAQFNDQQLQINELSQKQSALVQQVEKLSKQPSTAERPVITGGFAGDNLGY